MIADHDIARWRLRSQHLVRPHADTVIDVVANLLAVQAENPRQSEWAVAARTPRPSQGDIRAALDDGRLVRTHVLRPTWHYVRAEDIGWLLDVTAPRVRRVTAQQLHATYRLDERELDRATAVVVEAVGEQPDCTRGPIALALQRSGFDTSAQFVMILLAHLELDQVICSGRPLDDDHTYALFAERVPNPRRPDREDALGELAVRYFTGHGPATDRDLAYWATLTLGDVRRGLSLVREQLGCFEHDGRTYWHAPGEPSQLSGDPAGHLLQILDELYRGYQDSRWVLDTAGVVPRKRESAAGMALVDAQLVAAMRRTVTTEQVVFHLAPYRRLTSRDLDALQQSAKRYADYLGRAAELVIS
ncbi:MAG: winged helix DNA-binding domain-containing protein [Jiangellaceae bacterium]